MRKTKISDLLRAVIREAKWVRIVYFFSSIKVAHLTTLSSKTFERIVSFFKLRSSCTTWTDPCSVKRLLFKWCKTSDAIFKKTDNVTRKCYLTFFILRFESFRPIHNLRVVHVMRAPQYATAWRVLKFRTLSPGNRVKNEIFRARSSYCRVSQARPWISAS